LIIGGGLAGCTVAKELSAAGMNACIVERNADIGGKARGYGCKSDKKCNVCGLCAVGALWQDVEADPQVRKLCKAGVVDIFKVDGAFSALIQTDAGKIEERFTDIVVATGFEDPCRAAGAGYDAPAFPRVFTGNALERLMKERGAESLLPEVPESVAFVLCYGSRNLKVGAPHCSQVCCAYSTRAAKVIKHYYPEADVVLFYMDLQAVNPGNYAKELTDRGIRLERCRPAISFEGDAPVLSYEDAEGKKKRRFDYLFLSTGIHPDIAGNTALADITGLRVKRDGFLDCVKPPSAARVYAVGCAVSPMTITDAVSGAKDVAAMLIGGQDAEGCAQ
jgi:heterodisulfide reductase subunit A